MASQLVRSGSLNNIPQKKIHQKIESLISSCKICSSKNLILNNLSIDGVCSTCSISIIAINRYAESNIPVEYWSLSMKDYKGEQILLEKYKEITSNLDKFYIDGKSFCFAGNHGCGKTMLNTNILKKACQKGYKCLYTTLSDIVSILTTAPEQEKYLSRKELMTIDILVIDEFDSRFMQSEQSSDLFGRMLENIFRNRSQNKLPTFLCTNSPNIIEAFSGSMKKSLESLMNGYIENVTVFGSDFRKTKSK